MRISGLPRGLEGLRVGHLTDLHIRGPRPDFEAVGRSLGTMGLDLLLVTGDLMSYRGDERSCHRVMGAMLEPVRTRLGIFGVHGNHDTPRVRRRLARLGVRWLHDEVELVTPELTMSGLDTGWRRRTEWCRLLERWGRVKLAGQTTGRLNLLLAHVPNALLLAARVGFDVVFSGHTHGGQIRLPGRWPLRNSCDLPLGQCCGVLRVGRTLGLTPRGLGTVSLPLRVFCRAQVPVYRLVRGEQATEARDGKLESLERW